MSRLTAFFVAAILSVSVDEAQAPKPTLLGQFTDWSAFTYQGQSGKVCFVYSQPKSTEPSGVNRDPIHFFVTHRPGEGVRGEINVITGYTYRNGSTATATVQVDAVRQTLTYDFSATDTAQYVQLPAGTYQVRAIAGGAPGAAGESTETWNGDTGTETLHGGAGGAGLAVKTTIPVGGSHLVQPLDQLGLVIGGSSGNLVGGTGGSDGGGVAGNGGRGGNGSGVFLVHDASAAVHGWLLIGPGGGGGGGNYGFLKDQAQPKGGPGALTLEATVGFSPASSGSGTPGIAPAYCLDSTVTGTAREFHDGPYTAGFGQDGNPGADGPTGSTSGGGGGGGAGCQGALGAESASGGAAGSGGGGGVGFSRYPVTGSSSSDHAYVHLDIDYWLGGAPSVWFDSRSATERATAGVEVCFPFSLSRNTATSRGPVTVSGNALVRIGIGLSGRGRNEAHPASPSSAARPASARIVIPRWGSGSRRGA